MGAQEAADAHVDDAAHIAVRRNLCEANWRALAAGESATQRYPRAVAEAERAFDLLAHGFGDRT